MDSLPFEASLVELGYSQLERLGRNSNEVYKAKFSDNWVVLKLGVPTQSSFIDCSNPWEFSIRQVVTERKILGRIKSDALANRLDYFELSFNSIETDYLVGPNVKKVPIIVKQFIDGKTPTILDELSYSLNYPRIEAAMNKIHNLGYAFLELYRKNLILSNDLLYITDVGLCKHRRQLANRFENYKEYDKKKLDDLFN